MKLVASLAVAAAAVAIAAPASAQFAKPEDAIKYRQSALFVMAQHFGRIGAMVNGRVPYDAAAASRQCRDRGRGVQAALDRLRARYRQGRDHPRQAGNLDRAGQVQGAQRKAAG